MMEQSGLIKSDCKVINIVILVIIRDGGVTKKLLFQ